MYQYISCRQQLFENAPLFWLSQIQPSAAFAQRHFGYNPWLEPTRWVDPQHLRPITCEKTRRDWTCEDAREVKHTQTGKGPLLRWGPRQWWCRLCPIPQYEWLTDDGAALRMVQPFFPRMKRSGTAPFRNNGRFQLISVATTHSFGNGVARFGTSKHVHRRISVMQGIGM